MARRALALVLVALFLAGCNNGGDDPADATPAPPTLTGPPPPPPPPAEGSVVAKANDTWRYQGEGNATVVSTVTGANATHVRLRTVSQREGQPPHTTITLFDARTLAILSVQDDTIGATLRFEPPLPILIPAADHEYNGTLVAATPFGDVRQPARANVTFYGLEDVTVPAGTFEAYRYNATIRSEGLFPFAQTSEIWFSPKVEQAVRTIRDGQVQELVSYAIADA